MADGQRELKSPVTPEEVISGELYGVLLKARGEAAPLKAEVIRQKLAVAEDFLERALAIKWRVTRVFGDANGRLAARLDSPLHLYRKDEDHPDGYDKLTDLEEPAYNYEQDFMGNERHGLLLTNYRPIRSISRYVFAFPGTLPIWTPTESWRRVNYRDGSIQLVPSTEVVYMSFNQFVLSTVGGGRSLPQSIYLDYEVGFTPEELRANYEDLLELVRLFGTLQVFGLAQTAISPGGAGNTSLSLDGLSRSLGFGGKWGPYSGRIELAMDRITTLMDVWKTREHGVPMVFA